MRRPADAPAAPAYRAKGEKASCKRLATAGAAYGVGRYARTPAEVVAVLFRDQPERAAPARPRLQHKHAWASLPPAEGAEEPSGMGAVYLWMRWELARRNPGQAKEAVYLHDGQESLGEARAGYLPEANGVEVLDWLHVTPRLWKAAHVFDREGSAAAEAFVRARLLRALEGKVALVIRGLRPMGTKRGLRGRSRRACRRCVRTWGGTPNGCRTAAIWRRAIRSPAG
jgi:hypothetical protein